MIIDSSLLTRQGKQGVSKLACAREMAIIVSDKTV